jgi:hypothetical protein
MRISIFRLLMAAGLVLVVAGALLAAVGGLGHRWEWWHFTTGLLLPALGPLRQYRRCRGLARGAGGRRLAEAGQSGACRPAGDRARRRR